MEIEIIKEQERKVRMNPVVQDYSWRHQYKLKFTLICIQMDRYRKNYRYADIRGLLYIHMLLALSALSAERA